MRLHDIHSAELLPRFAEGAEWEQNALDSIIKHIRDLSYGLGAPYTMQAIEALSDEDLQLYYEQYGIAEYYPDLTRPTRNRMLYELARIYRYLGTPHAIETLCDYIFDDVTLDLKVHDNLAFDESGNLVDPSLLDVFDVEISPDIPSLSPDANKRILDNILKFSRNSQALRDLYFEFTEDYTLSISKVEASWDAQIVVDIENDSICKPARERAPICGVITATSNEVVEVEAPCGVIEKYMPSSIVVLSGVLFSSGNFVPRFITDYFNNILMPTTQSDADSITSLGLTLQYAGTYGPFGSVRWDDNYTFEPLAVYTDINGENEYTDVDVNGLYCIKDENAGSSVAMCSHNDYWGSQVMTWRCKITKR